MQSTADHFDLVIPVCGAEAVDIGYAATPAAVQDV
jgi:hypothetical protein